MRLLSLLFFIFIIAPCSYAQKKQISEARTQIKGKRNLDAAENSMRQLLKDSANRDNIKIYLTLADAVHARYDVANEQFYLKQSTDTAALFNVAKLMFETYELLDSIDSKPDKKGTIKPKFRKKNAVELNSLRQNLYSGGLYFIRKKDYNSAYSMLDTYLKCITQPLFSSLGYSFSDSISCTASFWTVFCGYKIGDPVKALAYKDFALSSKMHREQTLTFLAEIYQQMNDTTSYVKTLHTGINENPSSPFFFTRIVDYYNDKGCYDKALQIADSALIRDPEKSLFLFGKSNALLNLGRYDECISVCDTLIAHGDTIPDIYFNAGVSYINKAVLLEGNINKIQRNTVTTLYKKALPYMEKFRELAPSRQDRWAPALYNIYLKLNMGRQFEEISKLLSNK